MPDNAITGTPPPALPEAGDTEPLIYGVQWDIPSVGPTRQRYAILSQPRTGSTFLTRKLSNIPGRLGLPSEYLGDRAIPRMAPRLIPNLPPNANVPLDKYLQAIERVRTTPDGWFGVKIQPHHLVAVTTDKLRAAAELMNRFDRVIILSRRDKLGQAVSAAIATATKVWVTDGREPDLQPHQLAELVPQVARSLLDYLAEDAQIDAVRSTIRRPVLTLDYADIEADGEACLRRVVEFLDPTALQTVPREMLPVPRKPKGDTAQALRQLFLQHINGTAPLKAG